MTESDIFVESTKDGANHNYHVERVTKNNRGHLEIYRRRGNPVGKGCQLYFDCDGISGVT